MKICFFGLYNEKYARTSTIREGLKRLGVEVIEVHEEIPNERMELSQDFTLKTTLHRLARKVTSYFHLMLQAKKVWSTDAIIVLHPGHLDLPLAWVLAKLGSKPLLFDNSISPYDTMFVGRSIAERSSIKAKLVKFVEGSLLRLADTVFVDTKLMAGFVEKEFKIPKNQIIVVPLGANDAVYTKAAYVPSKKTKVLFFGLYNPMHGAQHIIQAASYLKDDTTIQLTMLGDGYLKEDLQKEAKQEKLTQVTFTGFIPEAELVKQIHAHDIILGVFSQSPVFKRVIPNKVFAALACGRPLITAKLPASETYLKDGETALLVEPEDALSLAKAIRSLSQDQKKAARIAESGHQLYQRTGTPEEIAKTLLKKGLRVQI